MTFQIDTSAIHSASMRLEVIGNNISNSNTAGFKGSDFSDILATSMSGAIGARKAGTRQSFTQGNITASSNPLDMAISGSGFFRVLSNGLASYTRNGQFSLDKDGNIVNSTGDQLTGYGVDSKGAILTGAPVNLSIKADPYKPVASAKATLSVTLNAAAKIIPATPTFKAADPSTYTDSTTTTVYDASGGAHDVQTYYVKTSATTWDVWGVDTSAPATTPPTPPKNLGSLSFDITGNLTAASKALASAFTVDVAGAGASTTTTPATTTYSGRVDFDLGSAVQFGTSFAATAVVDGSPPGEMTGYQIAANGTITASYSNGASAVMGQVILASFRNVDGLAPTESNQWLETTASGAASLNSAGSGGLGTLQASATEEANVDLTAEMIKMISAQRVFQSAAAMVKKQDEVMQTVVQIVQ